MAKQPSWKNNLNKTNEFETYASSTPNSQVSSTKTPTSNNRASTTTTSNTKNSTPASQIEKSDNRRKRRSSPEPPEEKIKKPNLRSTPEKSSKKERSHRDGSRSSRDKNVKDCKPEEEKKSHLPPPKLQQKPEILSQSQNSSNSSVSDPFGPPKQVDNARTPEDMFKLSGVASPVDDTMFETKERASVDRNDKMETSEESARNKSEPQQQSDESKLIEIMKEIDEISQLGHPFSSVLQVWKTGLDTESFIQKAAKLGIPIEVFRVICKALCGVSLSGVPMSVLKSIPLFASKLLSAYVAYVVTSTIASTSDSNSLLQARDYWITEYSGYTCMSDYMLMRAAVREKIRNLVRFPSKVKEMVATKRESFGKANAIGGNHVFEFLSNLNELVPKDEHKQFRLDFNVKWVLKLVSEDNGPTAYSELILHDRLVGENVIPTVKIKLSDGVSELMLHPDILKKFSDATKFGEDLLDCSDADLNYILSHLYANTSAKELASSLTKQRVSIMQGLGIRTLYKLFENPEMVDKIVKLIGADHFIIAAFKMKLYNVVKNYVNKLQWYFKVFFIRTTCKSLSIDEFELFLKNCIDDDEGSIYFLCLLWSHDHCKRECHDHLRPEYFEDVADTFNKFIHYMPVIHDDSLVAQIVSGGYVPEHIISKHFRNCVN